jgi:hypothetical protein
MISILFWQNMIQQQTITINNIANIVKNEENKTKKQNIFNLLIV